MWNSVLEFHPVAGGCLHFSGLGGLRQATEGPLLEKHFKAIEAKS